MKEISQRPRKITKKDPRGALRKLKCYVSPGYTQEGTLDTLVDISLLKWVRTAQVLRELNMRATHNLHSCKTLFFSYFLYFSSTFVVY